MLGLHLVGPLGLVAAQLAGSLLALAVGPRQSGRKLAFNLALSLLEACLAGVVFAVVLAGQAPDGTLGLVATFAAVLATDLVSAALVLAAILLNDGRVARRDVAQTLVTGAVAAVTTGSLALVAVVVLRHDRQVALAAAGGRRDPVPRLPGLRLPARAARAAAPPAPVRQARGALGAVRHGHHHRPGPGPRPAPGRAGRDHHLHRGPAPGPDHPRARRAHRDRPGHRPAGGGPAAGAGRGRAPAAHRRDRGPGAAPRPGRPRHRRRHRRPAARRRRRRSGPCWSPTASATSAPSTPAT